MSTKKWFEKLFERQNPRRIQMNRRMSVLFSVMILCLTIGTVLLQNSTAKADGIRFSFPYYMPMYPCMHWSGGPHEWAKGPSEVYMNPNMGSGMDFACVDNTGRQVTFQVASMTTGEVIYASDAILLNNLGRQVAVKNTDGSIIRYGHLGSISADILNALNVQHVTYHIVNGNFIGYSGSSAVTDSNGVLDPSNIHLHVELRDGTADCCGSRGNGGHAKTWNGIHIGEWTFHSYNKSDNTWEYNYDGVAVREQALPTSLGYMSWLPFSYYDNGSIWTDVRTWLPTGFKCIIGTNCEATLTTTNSAYAPYVQFAGHDGKVGGGGLLSDLPGPVAPVPATTVPPTASPTCGTSDVSFYTATNFVCDPAHGSTQFGWSDPTNGWTDMPNYMNDNTSSLEVGWAWSVLAAENPQGNGGKICLAAYYPDLSALRYDNGDNVNKSISSVWVFNNQNCGGYTTIPNAPSNLVANSVTQTTVSFTFQDNSSNESGFHIYIWRTLEEGWKEYGQIGTNQTSFVINNLECGAWYTFSVAAFNDFGGSPATNYVNLQMVACSTPPVGPTNLVSTSVTQTTASFSFNDNSVNETGFNIYSWTQAGGWKLYAQFGANQASFTLDGFSCGSYYWFMVAAFNDAGESPWSNFLNFKTADCLPTATATATMTMTPTVTMTATATFTPTATATSTPIPDDTIFANGFESGNLSGWTSASIDGGNLSASSDASMDGGTFGLKALINDGHSMYVNDDTPNGLKTYRARFYFDPNTIKMKSGDEFYLFYAYSGTTDVIRIEMQMYSGKYQIRVSMRDDGSGWKNTSWYTISDSPHSVEIYWTSSTKSKANNGSITLSIDNVVKAVVTKVDNDTRKIDRVRLGPIGGIDSGTRGTVYFDGFESKVSTTFNSAAQAKVNNLSATATPMATATNAIAKMSVNTLSVNLPPTSIPTATLIPPSMTPAPTVTLMPTSTATEIPATEIPMITIEPSATATPTDIPTATLEPTMTQMPPTDVPTATEIPPTEVPPDTMVPPTEVPAMPSDATAEA